MINGLVSERVPAVDLRMLIWPEARSAQNSIAAVSADGSTVWALIGRLNLLVQPLDRVGGPRRCATGSMAGSESKEAVASFLQGDGAMTQPPLPDEGLAAGRDLLGRGRVDHVVVIGADLVVQALGRVCE